MVIISKTNNKNFPINVQVYARIGDKYYYCGIGKFCKTRKEAYEFASSSH